VLTEGWPALPAGSHAHAGVRIARNEVDMFYRLKSSDMHAASVSRCVSALLLARRMRAAFPGPLSGGEAGTIRPRSGRCQGGQRLFARTGVRSKSPAPPHGLSVHGRTESAKRGGLLFWLLFSWPRKRKVTRALAGARNCFETGETSEQSPSPPAPLPQAGEGST